MLGCYVCCLAALCFYTAAALAGFYKEKISSEGGVDSLHPSSASGNYRSALHSSAFLAFIRKYGRRYKAGSLMFQERYQIFLKSIERQKYLNTTAFSANLTSAARYGINQFSDLSAEEFFNTYLRSFPTSNYTSNKPLKNSTQQYLLPLRFDWRDKNFVTPVKNQLSTKTKLVRASEYNFKAQTGFCHYFPKTDFGVSINGYKTQDFSGGEESMMKKLIHLGPLVVIVNAISWQDYLGGIIQHHCSSGTPNHAVLVTGYDKTGDTPYWIVKNSWGTSWGADGYVFIKMGGNICGIADFVAVPLM
ncbi:cathepsin O isoform X2 [Xenopus laevis]|uniref:Cathepsin O isoform X2 n=1 Tax=Xenopus laevis TaxID=8355 RepID=A0A8J0TJN2_XENLA|nr:cathepsin O isoform X2 [Xenopus laevis]